jgi:hypothetical protein
MQGHVSERPERDSWFSARIRWVKEIAEVFRLSSADVIEEIEDAITSASLDLGLDAERRIKDRVVNCLHANNA